MNCRFSNKSKLLALKEFRQLCSNPLINIFSPTLQHPFGIRQPDLHTVLQRWLTLKIQLKTLRFLFMSINSFAENLNSQREITLTLQKFPSTNMQKTPLFRIVVSGQRHLQPDPNQNFAPVHPHCILWWWGSNGDFLKLWEYLIPLGLKGKMKPLGLHCGCI